MTAVIETRGLTKEFRGGRGVRNIDLKIEQGQVFGFLGPNGAGKSTFVKMLVGLLHPTSGEAYVLGLPAGALEVRKRIGYLPELFRYQEWLSAEEVLRFHARLCKLDGVYARERIRQVIGDVGLSGREQERVRNYSKGMQQRLGLACALLPEPEVLFLDEPASALDPGGRYEVRELLTRLCAQGMTVFLNTHLLEDVESICSDVALLMDGTILAQGSVEDILHPEPVWDFTVGGWSKSAMADLESAAEFETTLTVRKLEPSGAAVLEVKLTNAEQVAWLNVQLVQRGISVYAIEERKNRLESWFLHLTESRSGDSK
ncbi:MAG: ABC transporter [Alicyclobacillus sp. RIFOXYA1_FULL_53_8]|nr:MAG: ABC transporter [Alicyclobacillus sp. RIFOXYA1_FULL_53_8]